jgi:hypothetical protein
MTTMLVIAAIVIYSATVGGSGGTLKVVQNSGGIINKAIERIDP